MLTCNFLGNSEFIHWTVKKQCLLHRPGGDWCPCGLCVHSAMEYMTAAVWPQWRCHLFPGSQMLTGMLFIYLSSLHSAQAKHHLDTSVSVYLSHSLVHCTKLLTMENYTSRFMSESQIVKSKCTMVNMGSKSVKFGFLLKPWLSLNSGLLVFLSLLYSEIIIIIITSHPTWS